MTQPVVLITGCSSGIGRALADAFKGAGYRVFAAARKGADLEALNAAGFTAVKLDVNDAEDIARAQARIKAEAGKVTVAEVEILVETGELDADQIHTPGIFVQRIVHNPTPEKRIEQRTTRKD